MTYIINRYTGLLYNRLMSLAQQFHVLPHNFSILIFSSTFCAVAVGVMGIGVPILTLFKGTDPFESGSQFRK